MERCPNYRGVRHRFFVELTMTSSLSSYHSVFHFCLKVDRSYSLAIRPANINSSVLSHFNLFNKWKWLNSKLLELCSVRVLSPCIILAFNGQECWVLAGRYSGLFEGLNYAFRSGLRSRVYICCLMISLCRYMFLYVGTSEVRFSEKNRSAALVWMLHLVLFYKQ